MTVNVKLEILDHETVKFSPSDKPLKELQKTYPEATRGFMLLYMEKYNMVWCKTFQNFLNIGPLVKSQIK